MEIKLLSKNATLPTRNNKADAGFDIYASEDVVLEPQQKALISTDVAVNIPEGYVGLLTSRSGISSKTHLVVETGKVDSGYQGNMKINVKNDFQANYKTGKHVLSVSNDELENNTLYKKNSYKISKGDKLAQLIFVPIFTPELEIVEEFSEETPRGENGFGSSGYTKETPESKLPNNKETRTPNKYMD